MIELSFPIDLYSEAAVAEAVRTYREFAQCAVERVGESCLVRVTTTTDVDEQLVADELGNYVLGLTIERRGG